MEIKLPPAFKEFLRLLDKKEVEYLLIALLEWEKRRCVLIDEMEVNFISLKHLKINKKASGSYKEDLNDLKN